MQEAHKTKHRKVFEKSSTTRENCSKTDLQKQSIPRKTRSCSFRSGEQFKERKASRFHSRRRRLFDGKRIRRGNSAILRGNFRHRVDRRSGEEVRTPLRSMHYRDEDTSRSRKCTRRGHSVPESRIPRQLLIHRGLLNVVGARNGDRKRAECEGGDKSGEP